MEEAFKTIGIAMAMVEGERDWGWESLKTPKMVLDLAAEEGSLEMESSGSFAPGLSLRWNRD